MNWLTGNELNLLLFRWLYGWTGGSPWLAWLAVFAAVYLGWLMLALIIIYFVSRPDPNRQLRRLILLLTPALFAWLAAAFIKLVYFSPRPFVALTEVVPLVAHLPNNSFPSAHAAFFFALAYAIYQLNKSWGSLALAAAAAVGLGRVVVGIHWPVDVLGGFLLAVLAVLLVETILGLFYNRGTIRTDDV